MVLSIVSYATAGFSPKKIKPTTELPKDFEEFWDNAKAELAEVPIKPVMTLMPERCTDLVDVYHVSLNNIKGKVYGVLCKPKKIGEISCYFTCPGCWDPPLLWAM